MVTSLNTMIVYYDCNVGLLAFSNQHIDCKAFLRFAIGLERVSKSSLALITVLDLPRGSEI